MSFKVTLTSKANTDLQEILAYYDDKSLETSKKFASEFVDCLDVISTLPKGFPVAFSNVRKMVMPKFPFNIYYSTKPRKKEVIIARIWHQKRNPKSLTTK